MLIKTKSIKFRLMALFFVLVILPGTFGATISYHYATSALKKEIIDSLKTIAQSNLRSVKNQISERKEHAFLLSKTPSLVTFFETLHRTKSKTDEILPSSLKNYLTAHTKYGSFNGLFLIDSRGNIIHSNLQDGNTSTNLLTGKYRDSELAKAYRLSTDNEKPYVSSFALYPPSNKVSAFVVAPVFNPTGQHIGSVGIQINANSIYEATLQLGLGQSGEVIFTAQDKHHAVFLSKLKQDLEAKFQKISFGSHSGLPIQLAASGESGSGIHEDYRGNTVIAHWKYIPETGWGIVVKIDEDEAMAPVRTLTLWYLLLAVISIVLMFLSLRYASNTLVSPIQRLIDTTRQMSSGNSLIRACAHPHDSSEITELCVSFNEFCDNRDRVNSDIEAAQKKLDMIISYASQGIITIDENHKIILFNSECEKLFGYTAEEVMGKDLNVLVPHMFKAGHKLRVDRFLQQEERVLKSDLRDVKVMGLKKNGYSFPIEASISKIKVANKWIITAFITDITERIQARDQLIQSKNDAVRANHAKSAFLANMSHELRTPLHGILSFAKFGMKKSGNMTAEKSTSYFEQIHSSGNRLLYLLNDILDLAKLEAGKMELRFTKQSLTSIIETAVKEQESLVNEKNMRIHLDNVLVDSSAEIDTQRITQVVANLLSNAVKFNDNGGLITITLTKVMSHNASYFCFSIKDEGAGIPEDELEHIFGKFNQSMNTVSGVHGTGLGLPISREIVNAHHGRIWAENHPDGGAWFRFEIPVEQPKPEQLPISRNA
ncbi:MAG: ATP-binding protein [Gammaproteobacteria bacterium]|nr:ATP-binding protein [Gammaproteobacteria bacterium]MDH5801802.1 ATP-binding protein [Gammaproteobacteria bacterium]